jgi:hypothetical protein
MPYRFKRKLSYERGGGQTGMRLKWQMSFFMINVILRQPGNISGINKEINLTILAFDGQISTRLVLDAVYQYCFLQETIF